MKLAELFTEFVTKNQDETMQGVDDLGKKVERLKDQYKLFREIFKETGEDTKRGVRDLSKGITNLNDLFAKTKSAALSAFAGAGVLGALFGFARAGFSGTTAMTQLSTQMTFLSREIAQLFLPQIRMLIAGIRSMTRWFRNLSGDQQRAIGWFAATTAALLALTKVVPLLILGIKGIAAAVNTAMATNPVGIILTVIGAIIALIASTKEGRDMFAQIGNALKGAFAPFLQIGSKLLPILLIPLRLISRVLSSILKAIQPLIKAFERLYQKIGDAIAPVAKKLEELFSSLAEGIGDVLVQFIESVLVPAIERLVNLINRAIDRWSEFMATIRGVGLGLMASPLPGSRTLGSILNQIGQAGTISRGGSGGGNRETLTPARTQFEDATSAFRRIQQTALNTALGDSPEQRQLRAQEQATQVLQHIQGLLEQAVSGFRNRTTPPAMK